MTALVLFIGAWVSIVAENRIAFAAPLTIGSSLLVSERYDNNLYLSQTDPVGDLTTTVSPRVDLAFDQRPIQGTISYQATGEWYRQRSAENRLSHQGEVQASLKAVKRLIPRSDVQISGQYSRAGELPDTSLSGVPSEQGGSVLLPRTETIQWGGTVVAGYPWTRRLDTRLEYGLSTTRYDAFNLAELGDLIGTTPALAVSTHDSVTHNATLRLRYRLSPSTTITLNPGWSSVRVDPAAGAASTAPDTVVTTHLTTGAEYTTGQGLAASGEIGVMFVEDDQARVVADVSLQRSLKRGHVALTAGQEIGAGGGVTDSASVVQQLGVNASHALGAKMQVSLVLDYSRNVSLSDDPLIESIRIQTYRAGGGATYQFSEWLDGRIDYSYFVQDSVGIAIDGRRHVVTLGLTARAPRWRLLD